MNLYPLVMMPCFRSGEKTPWGGDMLSDAFLKNAPHQTGESLEVSVIPDEESLVREGTCAGRTLPSMVNLWKDELMGSESEFPISVKLIDVDNRESEKTSTSSGSVIRVILNCDPDGYITIDNTDIAVRPGNVFHIPAGSSYKAGPSMQIYEAAYIGSAPAASVHCTESIFGTTSLCKGGSRTYYVSDGTIELCRLNVFGRMPLEDSRMLILTPFAPCHLISGNESYDLMPFDTVIIPANLNDVALESDDCKVMMVSVSDRDALRSDLAYRSENVAGLID